MKRRRFLGEALVLAILLVLWAGIRTYLSSRKSILSFVERPHLGELLDLADGRVTTTAQGVLVPAARGNREMISFGGVRIDPGHDYLLRVRATAGPDFEIVGLDRRGAPEVRRTIPSRGGTEDSIVFFRRMAKPTNLRIRLFYQGWSDFELQRLTFYRVGEGYRWSQWAATALGPFLMTAFCWRHRRRLIAGFAKPDPVWDSVVSGLLFVACLWIFLSASVQQIIDVKFTTAVSQVLLEKGTVALSSDFGPTSWPNPHPLIKVGDNWIHFSASATAILDAPFVAAYGLFGIRPVSNDGYFLRHNEERILGFVAPFLAAVLCVVLYGLARSFLAPGLGLLATGVFALGTQVFSTLSRPYWTHSWAVLLLAIALYLVVSRRLRERAWSYVASATLLSWSVACRPTMALSAVAVAAFVAVARRRNLALFLATGLAWPILFLIGSILVFGASLPPYFGHAGGFGSHSSLPRIVNAALGCLISPGRGLLLFVPIFGWILWETRSRWGQLPSRKLATTSIAVIGAHWLMLTLYGGWSGGQSFGPRLFVDVLPWFFLLGVLAVSAQQSAVEARRSRWSLGRVTVLALAVAASIFVNTRGATSKETWYWRSYDRPPRHTSSFFSPGWAWNWRYPQFMAGLLPADEPVANPPPDTEAPDGR